MRRRKDDRKKTVQMLSFITQLGLVMIVSIGLTTAIGIWLGKPVLTVVLFFVGAIAGGKAAYNMIQQTFDRDDGKNDQDSEKDR